MNKKRWFNNMGLWVVFAVIFSSKVMADVKVVTGNPIATCPSGYVVTGCSAEGMQRVGGGDSMDSYTPHSISAKPTNNSNPNSCSALSYSWTNGNSWLELYPTVVYAVCAKVCN